jgi:hypothetical protein
LTAETFNLLALLGLNLYCFFVADKTSNLSVTFFSPNLFFSDTLLNSEYWVSTVNHFGSV